MFDKLLFRCGLRRAHLQLATMGSVALCVVFWMRAAGYDQDERGNAERRALFVGLWAPTLWVIGQSLGEDGPTGRPAAPGTTDAA
ncbi:hypothetical protein FM076_02215 [Streptomyces albus subsp. chlorinus]|nr:hypothetical protein [Streptomyces albus subsp. chlorinus]